MPVERKFHISEGTNTAFERLAVTTGQSTPAAQLTHLLHWCEELVLSTIDQEGVGLYERRELTPAAKVASQRRMREVRQTAIGRSGIRDDPFDNF